MSKTAEIIEYDKVAEAIVKKTESRISVNRAGTRLIVNLDDLYGKVELEVVANMIIADIRSLMGDIEFRFNQLSKIKDRLEEK